MDDQTWSVVAKIGGAVGSAVVGYMSRVFTEWRKKVYFTADLFSIQHVYVDKSNKVHEVDELPPETEIAQRLPHEMRYSFSVRMFNKKSEAVGLHRISVRFTKGPAYWRRVVFEDLKPTHLQSSDNSRIRMRLWVAVQDMTLPSHAWTTDTISGTLEKASQSRNADAVWFCAESAEGKQFRWKVADLPGPSSRRTGGS